MAQRAAPTTPSEGEIITLMIDPAWQNEHRNLWRHPQGAKLYARYVDLVEQGVQESSNASWSDIDTVGRAESYKTYTGTSNREIELTFTFVNENGDLLREVVNPARFLDALKYPVYDLVQDVSHPPPPCWLRIGSLLTARVILTGGSPIWKGPIDPRTLLPHQAEFQATFTVVRQYNRDLSYRFDGLWT